MTRRLLPGGLRAQLALAIALVTAITVGASFLALYGGTSSRLQSQIDAQLRTQAAEWHQFTTGTDFRTPSALERTGTQFIAAQRYHAESLIIVVQVTGGRTISNNSELLAREEAREQSPSETAGLHRPGWRPCRSPRPELCECSRNRSTTATAASGRSVSPTH